MSAYTANKTYASGSEEWLYPHESTPLRGVKLHILQEGGVSIQGVWEEGAGYMGWQRLHRRNYEKEEAYKAFLLSRKLS